MILLYIGPGVGVATIVIIGIVLLIVLLSLVTILIRPVKRLFNKLRKNN